MNARDRQDLLLAVEVALLVFCVLTARPFGAAMASFSMTINLTMRVRRD